MLFWLIVHILPNVHTHRFLCACTLFVHTACIDCAECTQCGLSSATASSTSPTFTLCGRTASHGPTSTLYNSLVYITTCLQCVCHPLPSASYFPSSTSTPCTHHSFSLSLESTFHISYMRTTIKSWNSAQVSALKIPPINRCGRESQSAWHG